MTPNFIYFTQKLCVCIMLIKKMSVLFSFTIFCHGKSLSYNKYDYQPCSQWAEVCGVERSWQLGKCPLLHVGWLVQCRRLRHNTRRTSLVHPWKQNCCNTCIICNITWRKRQRKQLTICQNGVSTNIHLYNLKANLLFIPPLLSFSCLFH